ncbi:MAG: hypothetical protein JWP03_2181 [Phycisphaerales bacterium]|nr:hypothetical protein [Phycisphaerales bacterium]
MSPASSLIVEITESTEATKGTERKIKDNTKLIQEEWRECKYPSVN